MSVVARVAALNKDKAPAAAQPQRVPPASLQDLVLGKPLPQPAFIAAAAAPRPALPRAGSFQDLVLSKGKSPVPAAGVGATAAPPAHDNRPILPRAGSFQDLVLGASRASQPPSGASAPAQSHTETTSGAPAPAALARGGSFQDLVLKKATANPSVVSAPSAVESPPAPAPPVERSRSHSLLAKIAALKERKMAQGSEEAEESSSGKRLAALRAEIGMPVALDASALPRTDAAAMPAADALVKAIEEARQVINKHSMASSSSSTAASSSSPSGQLGSLPSGAEAPAETAAGTSPGTAAAPLAESSTLGASKVRFADAPPQAYEFEADAQTENQTELQDPAAPAAARRKSLADKVLGAFKRKLSFKEKSGAA